MLFNNKCKGQLTAVSPRIVVPAHGCSVRCQGNPFHHVLLLKIEGWVRCYASSFKCFRTSKYCEKKNVSFNQLYSSDWTLTINFEQYWSKEMQHVWNEGVLLQLQLQHWPPSSLDLPCAPLLQFNTKHIGEQIYENNPQSPMLAYLWEPVSIRCLHGTKMSTKENHLAWLWS